MILNLFIFAVFATSAALAAVVVERENSCSLDEFACGDGACVSLDHLCDGRQQCADGSDEASCFSSPDKLSFGDVVISRSRRQAESCPKGKWRCRDGTCIDFDGECDGVIDCPDGSDETFPLCRKSQCQFNWFRCAYGACVDGSAPCNGRQECADNSDELLARCRNETDEVKGKFRCQNGDKIPIEDQCDGVVNCADGSDETVRACTGKPCPSYLFQCAYGACVDQGADCNGRIECADGSDESDELCNRTGTSTGTGSNTGTVIRPSTNGKCVLPPYPEHGRYTVGGAPNASPGQTFGTVQLNVTCNSGFGVIGESTIYCIDGSWSVGLPQCVRFCRLNKHPSVHYRCRITQGSNSEGLRDCDEQEPSGTVVTPQCNYPNYYYAGGLKSMRCIDGFWDYVAVCTPECGRITPIGEQLVIGGRVAKHGELPWHAGIYRKTTKPYMQICGGSLVSSTVVISAAHCFWNDLEEKAHEASRFAVAVGKIHRPWNNPNDTDAQKSDVSDIKIPIRFQGASANFQDDIAIMLLTTTIEFKTYVRPVCVDFDIRFDRRQLTAGKMGKVAGWGYTTEQGIASQILKVVDLPYVSIEECIAESPPGFREYITSDKVCAGYRNGTALCKGDSGGGLVFPESDRGIERFYLRGVVSTAPNNENLCNANAMTSFTQITKHEHFIKEYLFI